MRRPVPFLALLLLAALPARAEDAAPAPGDVGVRVEKPAGDGVHYSQGSGVYLGDGLVLTAAHVIEWDLAHPAVTILIDGVRTPGTLAFDGTRRGIDLALVKLGSEMLSVKRIEQAGVPVCARDAATSKPVTVAALGQVTESVTLASPIMREGNKTVSTAGQTNILATGYHPGNSGGGVFDPVSHCLMGILSFELGGILPGSGKQVDYTAFVPASRIAPFLNAYQRSLAAAPAAAR